MRIRKIGYQLQTMMVSISPADTTPITLVLSRAVELPAVVTIDSAPKYTSAALRSFEDRRRNHASGYFMSEAQIRKEDGRPLVDALRVHVSNVQISVGSAGAQLLERSPRCGVGGPPDVYLDGIPLAHPMPPERSKQKRPGGPEAQPMDLQDFQLENLAGIEYYAISSTAPAEFGRTSTACGALFLWSRVQ